jgi:hypothetical protein
MYFGRMFQKLICSGPIPTTSSNDASVVNFYNATSSLVRFENENIFFYFEKTL